MAFIDAVIRSLSSSIHPRNHHQREHRNEKKKNISVQVRWQLAAFFHISHHLHRDAVLTLEKWSERELKKMVTYLNYLIDRPTVQPTTSQQDNCSSHQFETLFTPNAHRNYDKFHFELFSVLHVSLARMCTCIFFFSRSIVTPRYECMYFMQQHDGDGMCRLSWEIQRASIIISAVAGCICEWSIYYSDYIPITIDYYYFDLDVTNECVINWKL